MKDKIFILMLTLIISLTAIGCGSTTSDIDILSLQNAMLAASDSLPDMTTVNSTSDDAEELFSYLSDLDYNKVESYFLSYSSDGLADEVAVIIVKESSDVTEAKESLEEHVEGRVKLYENYAPDQTSRAEDAKIFTQGNCVVLIISDDTDAIKDAFSAAITSE